MAKTLSEINAQLAQLEAEAQSLKSQAEEMRNKDRAGVIVEMIKKIAEYNLDASDLRLSSNVGRRAKKATPTKAPAKYRGPNGEGWSGGRGRKPAWVTAALAEGKSIADFQIK